MLQNKSVQKLAAEIVNKSKVNGVIDEKILKNFTEVLVKSDEPIALQILGEVEKALSAFESSQTIFVESAYLLANDQLEGIKDYFQKQLGKVLDLKFSVNKELLGGVRVQVGDFVWENSVVSRLTDLKERMAYE